MIDAERLLGKVLSGAMGSTGKKRKKRKYRKNDDLVGGLIGGLTSGKGLVTAIGLGIGAYEILKSKSAAAGGTAPTPPSIQTSVPPFQSSPAAIRTPPPPPAITARTSSSCRHRTARSSRIAWKQ